MFKSFDPATVTSIKPGSSNFIDIFSDDKRSQTLELSVKLYTNALEHDSNDISFYLLRSYALSQCGNFETALADAEEVLKVEESNPEGYFVKMKALAGLNKFIEAADAQRTLKDNLKRDEDAVELSIKSKIRRDFIIWSSSKEITNSLTSGESRSKSSKLESKRSKSSKKEENRKRPAENSDPHSPEHVKRIVSKVTKVDRDRSPSPRNMEDDNDLHVVDSIGDPDIPFDPRDERANRSRSRSLEEDRKRYRDRGDEKRRSAPEAITDRRDSGRPSAASRPTKRERSRSRSPNYSRPPPPVNIYRFTGIRIRNIYPQVQRKLLENLCAKYGRILNIEIKDREAVVTFDNAEAPRRAISDLHNTFVHRISNFSDKLQVRFALGNNQDKFHMRNVRRVECDECHFYRTTGCEDKNCPERHIPFNQGIDLQPWMKRQHK